MKEKTLLVSLIAGMAVLLGGLLTYGLGVHDLLPVPRPDLVVVGTTLIGILLIGMGLDLFSPKTKEMQIEENDERNVAIAHASMASGFQVMTILLGLVLFVLIFMGYMNVVSCFSIIGVLAVGQGVCLWKHWYLSKRM
ncbi:MAG: hypothetical protein Q4D42_07565 [Eubacteriales bacterium]|nr:hypothetical protein [Eubacteriales bacterium]